MNFFDGIEFVRCGNIPNYSCIHTTRKFDGYFGIQYNHCGNCKAKIDDEPEVLLKDGDGFFSAPGRIYSYGNLPDETRHHCFVCFSGPRVQSFIDGGLFSPYDRNPFFHINNMEKFYHNMLELQNLLRYPSGFRTARCIYLLEGLLLQIKEQSATETHINPYLRKNIDQLRRDIAAQPQNLWDFEMEAKKISVSYPHFRRIFREMTGFAPAHFLIECRLNTAANLLVQSNLPINEIAHLCGYKDEYYFFRIFKRYRFCTASEYRKKFGD